MAAVYGLIGVMDQCMSRRVYVLEKLKVLCTLFVVLFSLKKNVILS